MRFSIYQESRKGGRRVNQDRMGYLYTRESLLMMVADGMGGHARGEIAAETMVQVLATRYPAEARPKLANPARFLKDAVEAAHHELHRYRAERALPEAPRTTLVACIVQDGMATWAHVGDSRLYLVREGRIAARTLDHSRVHHLVAAGLIRPEDAKDHPERNRIYNCIGANVPPQVDVARPVRLRRGDTVLLCTDGLWGVLPDERLASAFGPAGVMRVVPELIGLALHEGGPESDNCTAVAMTWAGEESIDMIPPSEGPVSTLMIPEGAVSSTIQMRFPGDDVPDTEFTEDRIDEAVAEIQRAIQRSSKLISR